jgi:hypothetical protein
MVRQRRGRPVGAERQGHSVGPRVQPRRSSDSLSAPSQPSGPFRKCRMFFYSKFFNWHATKLSWKDYKKYDSDSFLSLVITIDYRCEDGSFLVFVSCVACSNLNALYCSERGSSSNQKLKKHLSDWAGCQKAIGGIYFTKKWKAETLQTGWGFDNFKPRIKAVSSNASPRCTARLFLRMMRGVFWKRESRPIQWHQYRL